MDTTTSSETVRNTPRDTFLYLLAIITLVASAVSFGILVYQFIDLKFPDPLRYGYYYSSSNANLGTIRGALAALIVLFPVFFWVSWFLRKDIVAHPEKRDLKIRRWLLYLTVFVASMVVIGDLVALIYNFLEGDLTTPFILKVLTILFIAGSTLFYYLSELRERSYPRRAFQAVVGGAVVLAVIYGFFVAGSPQNQRLVRFDERKVSDLASIQSYLVYTYWQQKGALPASLSELSDPISSFMVPNDPQTGQPYEYRRKGERAFQLCAEFNLPSQEIQKGSSIEPLPARPDYYPRNENWEHGAGRTCFDRTIDPDLYPTKLPVKPL
ncbi:MAG: hypothetical protein A3C88_01895 [Candidatus Yanofskybacteria bacterium RIFCSPHIGHO2_02_FULL_50_12]|uniref:DUF5671 domain-containing protein n=1 Tax=Candidatus Yanofskybacteria bacterium RIFCSPHIGHO2_02_FULL_50_12 TaxID=1802685 RepID=A0A1F8FV98_9BACT|nr:MAG: hypothetical protein A3C88_01895 [Candidatus Yanofskybacteria bacterium RIFCSPHIGHO2_02_FULL_50_12]